MNNICRPSAKEKTRAVRKMQLCWQRNEYDRQSKCVSSDQLAHFGWGHLHGSHGCRFFEICGRL